MFNASSLNWFIEPSRGSRRATDLQSAACGKGRHRASDLQDEYYIVGRRICKVVAACQRGVEPRSRRWFLPMVAAETARTGAMSGGEMFGALRGANGRRHEVDFGDGPVVVDVSASPATIQITMTEAGASDLSRSASM
jgi:hypothetical protein